MKFLVVLLIGVFFMLSCTENDKKLDTETNTYYAKYKYIFENYDSLGIDASVKLLDEYIKDFPNAIDAYKFKAYLLYKDKQYSQVENTVKQALENTGKELEVYNYYVSLLLQDTINIEKAKSINEKLATLELKNLETQYNNFWINIYSKEYKLADSISNFILETDSNSNIKYLRSKFILAAAQKDKEKFNNLKFNDNKKVHLNLIDSVFLERISLQEYYQILSK